MATPLHLLENLTAIHKSEPAIYVIQGTHTRDRNDLTAPCLPIRLEFWPIIMNFRGVRRFLCSTEELHRIGPTRFVLVYDITSVSGFVRPDL